MLNNKIKNILLLKDMSPSRFADEIGVQRSSISHILSGRNRPSLEIVQRIVRRFPELGMDWILEEDETPEEEEIIEKVPEKKTPATIATKTELTDQPGNSLASVLEANQTDRKIDRILVFYSDKTFSEYRPV